MTHRKLHWVLYTLTALAFFAGCAKTSFIAGTRIPATRANKEIIEVVENYRRILIAMDAEALIQLAHPNYYQPKTSSDEKAYDRKGLAQAVHQRFAQLKNVRLDIQYRRIKWESAERVSVEVYLDGSYQLIVGEDNRWEKKTDYMRLTLEKHKDKWLFVSGI
jgi:hypothetical protein